VLKYFPIYLIISLLAIEGLMAQSKKNLPLGYRIEGDEVVFVFDVREYQKANEWQHLDFAELEIHKVAIAGEFNNWRKQGWTMHKVDKFIYELRKKLKDFEGKPTWEYKFVINEKYWIEPPRTAPNRVNDEDSQNNLVFTTIKPSLKGNTMFRLKGYPKAFQIFLAGSFNNWQEKQLLFGKEGDEWVCRIDLPEGKHAYKFIVDGHWITDPENSINEDDGAGNINSILYIGQSVSFRLRGYENAKKVQLAGSFNNWQPHLHKFWRDGNDWVCKIILPKGKYTYKVVVDGKWLLDPDNANIERDEWGNRNSLIDVQ
jgi:1,4-alpha-glucan branching enzyme